MRKTTNFPLICKISVGECQQELLLTSIANKCSHEMWKTYEYLQTAANKKSRHGYERKQGLSTQNFSELCIFLRML